MTHPSSPPAPMTAERLYEVREQYRSGRWGDGLPRELFGHIDALTARVAELERERQYTCEQHRDEVRKGERCVWCELAAARGAFDLSESERQRLAGRINATEARKVEDGDVQDAVDWLRDRAECSSITLDPAPMGPIADLLTRLSAALKEWQTLAHGAALECEQQKARAQAAEAKLETARRDALEEAASLAAEYGRAISKGLRRSAGPNDTGEQIAESIRALQTKDTTE